MAVVAAVSVVGLAACGTGGGDSAAGAPASASGEQAAWQQEDPCSLLAEQDLRPYLGDEAGSVSPKRTSESDRPTCEWKSGDFGEVTLGLWQPPAPDIVTDTDKTVEVGERTGYITSETELSCAMDVKAAPAYVQLHVRSADVDGGREHYCEVAAETARAALTKLGW
ncbi:Protein of unknown function (DUF3558) [Prauserella aidingensis]|nr:Protein of unknown function (DUF3558) [Prauserella aidingensis]